MTYAATEIIKKHLGRFLEHLSEQEVNEIIEKCVEEIAEYAGDYYKDYD